MNVRALVAGSLLAAGLTTACGAAATEVSVGQAPGSTVGTLPAPAATASTTTTTTIPTTSTTSKELGAARPVVVKHLQSLGASDAFAGCVADTIAKQFTGPELAFAVGVLSLDHPTAAQIQEAVTRSGVNLVADADLPDRIFAVQDQCRALDSVTTLPAALTTTTGR